MNKEEDARMYRKVIDDRLWQMQKTFQKTGGLDMDAYHGLQNAADHLAKLCGVTFQYTPSYPNPCAEILLRSTRPDNA